MIAPDVRSRALQLLSQGIPQREVARRCGIGKGTVSALAKEARTPAPVEPTQPDPAELPTVDALASNAAAISRHVAARQLRIAELAEQEGNFVAAQRALKSVADTANNVARAERQAQDTERRFCTEAELKDARRKILDLVDRIAKSPEGSLGMCPGCGARIRVAAASAGTYTDEGRTQ